MSNYETVRKRLEIHILSRGYTFREVSLKIGRMDAYIHQYIKYGLPKRLSEVDRKRICNLLDIPEAEMIDDDLLGAYTQEPEARNSVVNKTSTIFDVNVYSSVIIPDVAKNLVGKLFLNSNHFSYLKSAEFDNSSKIKALNLDGDYMMPAISPNSLVFYDIRLNKYDGYGIYVIEFEQFLCVRRLFETNDAKYLLKVDNHKYDEQIVDEDKIKIMGKVISCFEYKSLI